MCVCACTCGQRETETDRNTERETYFTELVHTVVEPGKSKTCRGGYWAGGPQKGLYCNSSPKVVWRQNSLLLRESQSFFLSTSTIQVGPTLFLVDYLLF